MRSHGPHPSPGLDPGGRERRVSVTNPTASGGTVTWTYSYEPTFSQLTQEVDPLGHATTYTVNGTTGDTTAVTDAKGKTTSFSFAANGDKLTETTALNQT